MTNSSSVLRAGLLLLALAPQMLRADEGRTGDYIYLEQCGKCHGEKGEGVKNGCDKPLLGDKSVAELAVYIAKTMPEDEPGTCTGEDARRVAQYLYDAFYSPVAQARNQPARIELSRLTVRQYRHTVTDLVQSFRPQVWLPKERGLKAEYYKSRRFNNNDRVVERIDPLVKFDYGEGSPLPEKISSEEFALRWSGGVIAPETGDYEFVIATNNSARLWVNDQWQRPLIDASVRSGTDKEHRATIHLLARRVYPIRLEITKDSEGKKKRLQQEKEQREREAREKEAREKAKRAAEAKKDIRKDAKKPGNKPDSKPTNGAPADGQPAAASQPKLEYNDELTSIELKWKLPGRVDETIPERNLVPNWNPLVFVLSTPFPPDDRSTGYERGTSISAAWEAATTDAAFEVAAYVGANLDDLSGSKLGKPDRVKKLKEFGYRFVERAFRRPLTDEQKRTFVDRHFEATTKGDQGVKPLAPELAVERVVLLALASPRFLYHELEGKLDAFDVACRLSFGLWDSLPDQQLRDAAAKGQLATAEQVRQQAWRMIADVRARAKLHDFFALWLAVDRFTDIAKDSKRFPEFDEEVVSDLRTSLDLFLDDVMWSEKSDFRQLLLADWLYLNGELARFYGAKLPAAAPFEKVRIDPEDRAGVLTHPYLMAGFAYTASSSPIHRGVFVARSVLGRSLRPPPEAVAPTPPHLQPTLTTRERIDLQTKAESCQTCHRMINPLGFAFENFDAVGRFRSHELGKPINSTGEYQDRDGKLVHFDDIRGLATYLAQGEETHEAFVEQLFHYLVKQPILAFGPDELSKLESFFDSHECNMRQLAVEIMATSALKGRSTKPALATSAPQAGRLTGTK